MDMASAPKHEFWLRTAWGHKDQMQGRYANQATAQGGIQGARFPTEATLNVFLTNTQPGGANV